MWVDQDQILLNRILAGQPDFTRDLGRNENLFTAEQRTCCFIDGIASTDYSVKEAECFEILDHAVILRDHAKDSIVVVPDSSHADILRHRNTVHCENRAFTDVPVKLGVSDCVLGLLKPDNGGSKAMPRFLPSIEELGFSVGILS